MRRNREMHCTQGCPRLLSRFASASEFSKSLGFSCMKIDFRFPNTTLIMPKMDRTREVDTFFAQIFCLTPSQSKVTTS